MEEWKLILINGIKTNYEVSNLGNIRNLKRLSWKTKGMLIPKFNKQNGYCQIAISLDGKKYYKYIHRLVATAFLNNEKNLPQVNHKDGNKQNNKVDNLEWVTENENMKHAFDNILVEGTQKPVLVYTLKGEFINEYPSISEAIRQVLPHKDYVTYGLSQDALFNPNCQKYGHQWRLKGSNVPVYNIEDSFHGSKGVVQLNLNGEYVKEFDTISDACRELNVLNNGEINKVCKGKQKTSHGYKWMYKKDYYNS